MPRRAAKDKKSTESSYLRRKSPVRVRKSFLRSAGPWLLRSMVLTIVICVGVGAAYSVDVYLRNSENFTFSRSAERLRTTGLRFVERQEITEIFKPDVGRSLYKIPLEQRRQAVIEISWVQDANVRRIWPNRLWVHVRERQPVAFVRLPKRKKRPGPPPQLIDGEGVLLDPPAGIKFDFPVLTGVNDSMPLADRRDRLDLYLALMSDLAGREPSYTPRISEVDVTDPKNARLITVFDGESIELQMGNKNFRHRFEVFLKYFDKWKKEFGKIRSVDLRYKGVVSAK